MSIEELTNLIRSFGYTTWSQSREIAELILASQASPAPVPDEQAGEWQWVPKEPTDEMQVAGALAHQRSKCHDFIGPIDDAWAAMLAASPSRPVAAEKREPLLSNMDIGVLRMPADMAMESEMSRTQFYARVQSLLDRIGTHPSTGGAD